MVNAEINLPDGTKITVDGNVEDIIKIKEAFSSYRIKDKKTLYGDKKKNILKRKTGKLGPLGRVRVLISEDFFKQKRTLDEVRRVLEEKAIFYKHSDLAPSLIRLVKKGELRRLKEDGQWRYVNL